MLLPAIHFYGFLLACIFTRSYLAFKNDATEILYSHVVKPAAASPSSNSTLNQARNGGRHYTSTGSDRNSEYPAGGTSTAALGGSAAWPGPGRGSGAPGEGAEPRSEPRIPWQRPGPPIPLPERGAPGNRRLGEAGPRGDAAGSRPGSASPGGPRASRPPTPVLGSPVGPALSGRLLPEGGSSRNAGFMGYPKGTRDKGKGERGISRALSFLTRLPLRAGEVSGLLFKCNKKL